MTKISRRDLGRFGSAAAVGMFLPSKTRSATGLTAGKPDVLALVDLELRPYAQEILKTMPNYPVPSDESLPMVRKMMSGYNLPPREDVPYQTRRIPGLAGAPEVTLYIINAKAGAERPTIVHTHGGGFVMGAARNDIRSLQEIAVALACIVVTVEYRLAPETNYRGSIEDNYAGLKWTYSNASEIGADRNRIALMGESAGGGHSTCSWKRTRISSG